MLQEPPVLRSGWVTVGVVIVFVGLALIASWVIWAIITWQPAYPV